MNFSRSSKGSGGEFLWRLDVLLDRADGESKLNLKKLATAVSKGVFIFSSLVWAYAVVDLHLEPAAWDQHEILAKLVPIREDYMAVISFALAGISFIAWEYLRSPDPH